ncbi:hypothetical protein HMPREF0072_0937 [Anaerococcus lactolyticus ATCC 51172]|uniref:Uncharacterized protein n=1 Tax=Anaerococcus lactolyticus ATCC 51172 TaxID=525254 RepID=C2BF17_9FIRM|nr:hypothetical protein HMPREF0072_0937 [Anaerococcus lactolyticus ATCC 51172]
MHKSEVNIILLDIYNSINAIITNRISNKKWGESEDAKSSLLGGDCASSYYVNYKPVDVGFWPGNRGKI